MGCGVAQTREEPSGKTSYKVHYDGWKPRWDEWIASDSGRVRSDTNPPPSIVYKSQGSSSTGSRLNSSGSCPATASPHNGKAAATTRDKSAVSSSAAAPEAARTALASNSLPYVPREAAASSKAAAFAAKLASTASKNEASSSSNASKPSSALSKMKQRLKGASA